MKETKKFSPDRAMLQLQRCLIHDLIPTGLVKDRMLTASISIKDWRTFEFPNYSGISSDFFKRHYQVENFLKRYIFSEDLHSASKLAVDAARQFMEDQGKYGLLPVRTLATEQILREAKSIVSTILGKFDLRKFSELCKWGKRAALGLERPSAYLDKRAKLLTFTTLEQLEWLKFVTWDDPILADGLGDGNYRVAVEYTTVPKSYKSQRGIAPDAIVGGFLSQGLGTYLRMQLEENTHIKLARAQVRHKDLARVASKTGKLATIDMSKASDSFVWEHILQLVPRDWLKVLSCVRTPFILVDKELIELRSYMLMGSAHTFPLQTILFYSLAQASINLSPYRGKASVFGDDIILPTSVAQQFMFVMGELGFIINKDKSFWFGKFRESCGGDYFDGHDVRPSMPEGTGTKVPFSEHLAFLYSVYNGLHERWDPEEIPLTRLAFELIFQSLEYQPTYGPAPSFGPSECLNVQLPGCLQPIYENKFGITSITQSVIREQRGLRRIPDEIFHYWDSLRSLTSPSPYTDIEFWNRNSIRKITEQTLLSRLGFRESSGGLSLRQNKDESFSLFEKKRGRARVRISSVKRICVM